MFGGMPEADPAVARARRRTMRRMMRGERLDCPCCGQRVALYPRRINRVMARQLAAMAADGGWMHGRDIELGDGADRDFAKARFFGLVESDGGARWRITQAGRDFVAGRATIPAVAWVYDNEPRAFSAERVSFADCLGRRFDLFDVLYGAPAKAAE